MSDMFDQVPDESGAAQEAPAARPPRRRRLERVLAGTGVTVGALLLLALLLYQFGSMWPPSAEARAAYAAGVAAGQLPPVGSSFHIPVPGCVCHSPDPVLQVQHESRHIRDCTGCHSR